MPIITGQDNWEYEIVMPDESTPVLGGTPEWAGRQMVSGFANIPSAQLANRTQYLYNRVNEIVNTPEQPANDPDALKKANNLSDVDNPAVARFNLGLGNVNNTSDMSKPVSTAVATELDKKVDKVAGKQLSTNDFTNAYKTKIDNLPTDIVTKLPQVVMTSNTTATVNKVYIFNADVVTLTLPITGMQDKDVICIRTRVPNRETQIVDFGSIKFRGLTPGQVYLDLKSFGLDIMWNAALGEWV